MEYTNYNIWNLKILLYSSIQQESIDFLNKCDWNDLKDYLLIDWYNEKNYDLVQWYLHDCHFPSPHCLPAALIGLPGAKTFGEDQVILFTNMSSLQEIKDEADWQMVDSIIQNVMMSESYKLDYLKKELLLNANFNVEVYSLFTGVKNVDEFKILYSRLAQTGKLMRDVKLEEKVSQELGVRLGETITLKQPLVPIQPPQQKPMKMMVVE